MNIDRIDECLRKLIEVHTELKNLRKHVLATQEVEAAAVKEVIKEVKAAAPEPVEAAEEFDADGGNEVVAGSKVNVSSETTGDGLKILELPGWPLAVPEQMICNVASEEDKLERAEGILELIIGTDMTDRSFLDFGCGEGHCAIKAAEKGSKVSVGYDIKSIAAKEKGGVIFTKNWDEVKNNGPYNTIMAYDVFDHIESETPIEGMTRIKEVLADDGKAYIRFHPWCSRHGGHLYQKLNKAFAHLILTEEELASLGHKLLPNQRVSRPLGAYRDWITKAGLKKVEETVSETRPEAFFSKNKEVLQRILNTTKASKFPAFQLKMNFIDYVVTK
tara:strand:- start:3840 stop:4835 length:996 start_codon:yes stop_codon:yes gene_type:complete